MWRGPATGRADGDESLGWGTRYVVLCGAICAVAAEEWPTARGLAGGSTGVLAGAGAREGRWRPGKAWREAEGRGKSQAPADVPTSVVRDTAGDEGESGRALACTVVGAGWRGFCRGRPRAARRGYVGYTSRRARDGRPVRI